MGRKDFFSICFTAGLLHCVFADEGKTAVKAIEAANVTLNILETSSNSNILWTFGPENPNIRIATAKKGEVKSDYDEHFRGRLQLNSQTGALTITQLRVGDSGIYKWQSIGTSISSDQFNVTVYSSVAPPSITVDSSFNKESSSSAIVKCSVDNSQDLILSWNRGNEILKNTSCPDLSSKLSLALEIESHDEGNYSCVAENPVDKKTTKYHREDTSLKDGEIRSQCQTDSTVRLVISAVFGMALIVLLVDYIRLRR